MAQLLVIKQLINVSDGQFKYKTLDRLSFRRLVGAGGGDPKSWTALWFGHFGSVSPKRARRMLRRERKQTVRAGRSTRAAPRRAALVGPEGRVGSTKGDVYADRSHDGTGRRSST
ncbi:MAG: hypothetical protein HZA24_12480 [Nitrospirae bacterium]|nr:hypothetical protein [Nitrospirota bacterium]